jgi:hypothetical protein
VVEAHLGHLYPAKLGGRLCALVNGTHPVVCAESDQLLKYVIDPCTCKHWMGTPRATYCTFAFLVANLQGIYG